MTLVAAWLAVAASAATLTYRWRHRVGRLCLVAIGTAAALVVTFLTTGSSVTVIFEPWAKTLGNTVIVAMLSAATLVKVLPRLRRRWDRWAAAVLCGALALAFAGTGMMLWRIADDGLQFGNIPDVRTGEGILYWRDSAPRNRIYGILVEGRLGDVRPDNRRPGEQPAGALMATYQCTNIGTFGPARIQPWLPTSFTITLDDGTLAWAQGISKVRQAWDWPFSGSRLEECGLRAGNPVVFWGHPGASHATGSDKRNPAVNETAVIAYGDIAAFRSTFGPAAERTGRAALALAGLNVLLAAAITAVGIRTFWKLHRDGNNEPPQIIRTSS